MILSGLEAALVYRSLGWPVIPTDGKEPHHGALVVVHGESRWGRFRDVSATEDEIKAWYEHAPGAGVAILTGTCSGVVVCDIEADARNTAPREIVEARTAHATTPGGGLHVYFATDEPVESLARATTGWGDLKAEGGFVVAPGGAAGREWGTPPWELQLAPFSTALLLNKSPAQTDPSHPSPHRGNHSPRGTSPPRGIPSLSNLTEWDRDEAYVYAVSAVIGIPSTEIGKKFTCVLPGHGSDSTPSANLTRHPTTGAVLYRCWHDSRTYPLAAVYAAAVSAKTPREFSGATLALWKLRLLLETGLIPAPSVLIPPLPTGAPNYAQEAYSGLTRLFQARALTAM